jgi:arginine repressor
MPAGAHVARAKYTPPYDAAYGPAESQTFAFSVWNSSVNNTLNFVSGSIGLGRNLEVRGQLRTQNGPVTNATVALALAHGEVAQTRTDENGTYAFSVPVNSQYFSAVPHGADVYTVFDPNGQPLDSATSATAHIPANFAGAYAVATTAALALVLGIFLYLRSFGWGGYGAEGVAVTPVTASKGGAAEPQPFQPTLAGARLESMRGWNEARDRAYEAFSRENDVQATEIIFGRAVASLSAIAEVRFAAYTTYSEISSAIQDAMPAVRIPLQQLTDLYELVQYGGRSLTQAQRNVALNAFESLRKHAEALEGYP